MFKCKRLAHPVYILYGVVLHGVEVSTGILQQCTKDEGEADAQVNIYGLNEAVGIGKGGAGPHHQSGHCQYCSHPWRTDHRIVVIVSELVINLLASPAAL